MQVALRAREGLGWIKIDHMAFRFTERRGLGNWGFIYLGTPFLIHNQRGGDDGGDGGDGKKGVFPSETELRELCLEGGRVMHVTVTFNLGGGGAPYCAHRQGSACHLGKGCVKSPFRFTQPRSLNGGAPRGFAAAACVPHLRPGVPRVF